MSIDSIFVSCLCGELNHWLTDGKIEKIQQPEKDLLIFTVRSVAGKKKVLISVASGYSRINLTDRSFENPVTPTMFCMLLRKHLTGARINSVKQINNDRILEIDVESYNDLRINNKLRIIVELIGRTSNVILVNSDGRIIDCIRRTGMENSRGRMLLPGMFYSYPDSQNKPFVCDVSSLEFSGDVPADKYILNHIAGICPLTAREIAYRAGNDTEKLNISLQAFIETVKNRELNPYLVFSGDNPVDYSYLNVSQYSGSNVIYNSFSELLEVFFSAKESETIKKAHSRELYKKVKTIRDRQQRKLTAQYEEMDATESREYIRQSAELIFANIYRIKKGDNKIECQDYFSEDVQTRIISLDTLLSPNENGEKLFREYKKMKSAAAHLQQIIHEGEQKLEYLDSILCEINLCSTKTDVDTVHSELLSAGIIKDKYQKNKKNKDVNIVCEKITYKGFDIFYGKNNIQNDHLTFKKAKRNDLWFHVKGGHGSHVVISCSDMEPDYEVIIKAAEIAVEHSSFSGAGKVNVDYTKVRNVRKPSGALPGKVIYTDYKTILV